MYFQNDIKVIGILSTKIQIITWISKTIMIYEILPLGKAPI